LEKFCHFWKSSATFGESSATFGKVLPL
jgi:hypothetical protein